jgi:hypothetical protein
MQISSCLVDAHGGYRLANAAEAKSTGAPAKSQEVLSADWTPRIQEYFLTIP